MSKAKTTPCCWRFVLMCHLLLQFVHLIVNHDQLATMQFLSLMQFGLTTFLNTWYCINFTTTTPLEHLTWLIINLQPNNKSRKYQHLIAVHSLAFGGRGCFFTNCRLKKKSRIFDPTLGFPGEGPKKTAGSTWADLVGPMCIYLDEKWHNGELLDVRETDVVYSISGSPDQFIVSKDEAHKLIRPRNIVKTTGTGQKYNGKNPLIFGPDGSCLYGRKITERTDRPGTYRVEIKFKPQKSAKVQNRRINLGKHVSLHVACCVICLLSASYELTVPCVCEQPDYESADAVCDTHIKQWLASRKKHATVKRKRNLPKQKHKHYARVPDKATCNTPKRSTRSTRGHSEIAKDVAVFSPVAPSMTTTPIVKHALKAKNMKAKPRKKSNTVRRCVFVYLFILLACHALLFFYSLCLRIDLFVVCCCCRKETSFYCSNKFA